jgi:AraC-like DNA-binding protein
MSALAMRSRLVGPALREVRAAGGSVASLVQRFGLGPTAKTDAEVSLSLPVLRSLFDAVACELGDPFLGIRMARRFCRGTFGLTEFVARTAPTLGAAWNRVAHYIRLLNDLVVVRVQSRGPFATIHEHVPGSRDALGRHANEFFVSMVVLQAREMCGVPIVPRRVCLTHDEPPDASELYVTVGCRLEFGAETNRVEFEPEIFDLPLLGADPTLHALLDMQAQKALASRASPTHLVNMVRSSIAEHLTGSRILDAVAHSVQLSPRTLQRRLYKEGASFQQLIDDVRAQIARREFDQGRSLSEVAVNLGYASSPPFLRAFKRWTGMTPGAYRHRGRTTTQLLRQPTSDCSANRHPREVSR